MRPLRPLELILLGFVLVLLGFVLPLLMLLGAIRSTFLLNFLSYAASVAGLLLGIVGGAMYTRLSRRE